MLHHYFVFGVSLFPKTALFVFLIIYTQTHGKIKHRLEIQIYPSHCELNYSIQYNDINVGNIFISICHTHCITFHEVSSPHLVFMFSLHAIVIML